MSIKDMDEHYFDDERYIKKKRATSRVVDIHGDCTSKKNIRKLIEFYDGYLGDRISIKIVKKQLWKLHND